MAKPHECELYVLQYTPDAVKGEAVNIGVVLVEPDGSFGALRFTRDWKRLRCLDPAADIEFLEAITTDLAAEFQQKATREKMLARMKDSFSGNVQISPAKACVTQAPEKELELLAQMYLEPPKRTRARESAGRAAIVAKMQGAFEQAGVWNALEKKIAVAQFTRQGDPLKIDCGYQPNGVVRLFHGVSLATDVDAAKVLAFSFPLLSRGIAKVRKAKSELTAIVEEGLDRGEENITFALETLEQAHVQIATVAELDRIAARARKELRV
jgi:hypothetical protein